MVFTIILTLGTFVFGLYLQEVINIINPDNSTNANDSNIATYNSTYVKYHSIANTFSLVVDNGNVIMHISEMEENAFLIVIAICIAIILLPFINKLKLGDIDIEVESAGSRPIGPTTITGGISNQDHTEDEVFVLFPPGFGINILNNVLVTISCSVVIAAAEVPKTNTITILFII